MKEDFKDFKKAYSKELVFLILASTYCVFTVIQNIFEMKTIGSSVFAIMGGGTIVSWITFVIMDIFAEEYGKQLANFIIDLATVLNIVVIVFAKLIILLPGTYELQNEAFYQIFNNGPRTILASIIAFRIGNKLNVWVMVKLKSKAKNYRTRKSFYFRAIASTVVGQYLDNLIFLLIAFAPIGISAFEMRISDIMSVVILGTLLEVLIESIFVPLITRPLVIKIGKFRNGV